MPRDRARRNASSVFSGASAAPPRCAIMAGAGILPELLHRPALAAGYLLHPGFGVDHHRVAEEAQHLMVGVVVGVAVGLREIEAVLLGKVLYQKGFDATIGVAATFHAPGEPAVDDLHLRG